MTEPKDKPALTEVLAEVNRLRAEQGMEPLAAMPKGTRMCNDCPIAVALHSDYVIPSRWTNGAYSPRGAVVDLPLPPLLNAFALAFDDGEYPELFDSERA